MQVPQASLVSRTMSNGIQSPSLDAKLGRTDIEALARDGNSLATSADLSIPDVSPDRVVLRVDSLLDGVAWLAGQSKSRQGRSNIPPCSACTVADSRDRYARVLSRMSKVCCALSGVHEPQDS